MLIDKEMIVRILPFGGSDLWLVQLEVQGIGIPNNKPFRFENIWLTHLDSLQHSIINKLLMGQSLSSLRKLENVHVTNFFRMLD